jgi:SAM-dependent methyltransferase
MDVQELKRADRENWALGDYLQVDRELTSGAARRLVERADIREGMEVLDVGTGTGAAALAAARTGARIVGLDLTPELLEVARGQAAEAGVEVEWIEGDAEELPFDNDRFDRVLSNFGTMFAPRHKVVAHELARVCKPGGTLATTNWTPEGLTGELLKLVGSYLPPAPDYAYPPWLWGCKAWVEYLFGGTNVRLEFERRRAVYPFDSVESYLDFYAANFGLMVKVKEVMSAQGRWDELRRAVYTVLISHEDAADGIYRPEYLLVVGRKEMT